MFNGVISWVWFMLLLIAYNPKTVTEIFLGFLCMLGLWIALNTNNLKKDK